MAKAMRKQPQNVKGLKKAKRMFVMKAVLRSILILLTI